MNKSKYEKIMAERYRIMKETYDNDYIGIEMCCSDMISLIKEDTTGFISFLKTDCSSQDYLFITEWFEEFVSTIKSQELIDAFRETIKTRFMKENLKYNIEQDLNEAIEYCGNGIIH